MAIDDNTVYGLTGAQVKELPGKIEAVKGLARTLTVDDYNYDRGQTGTNNVIALWLLEDGLYHFEEGVNRISDAISSVGTVESLAIISHSGNYVGIFSNRPWTVTHTTWTYKVVDNDGYIQYETHPLIPDDIVNNLTSTSNIQPLSAAQGKVLKDLIDSIAIRGAGAPTTSTVGEVGQLYEDGTNGALYQLKSINITVTPNTYDWEQVGGSSVNVVQATGTSTTDVMSQNAVTSMIYADPSSMRNVSIGSGTLVQGGVGQVALGENSHAYAVGEAALASYSGPSTITQAAQGVAYLNANNASFGYNNSNYRLLTGLYDGQSAHDAATVGQINATIDAINTALSTSIPHIGA